VDKYFYTLDEVFRLFKHKVDANQMLELMKTDLEAQHDAGPEARWIIKCWSEDRGVWL